MTATAGTAAVQSPSSSSRASPRSGLRRRGRAGRDRTARRTARRDRVRGRTRRHPPRGRDGAGPWIGRRDGGGRPDERSARSAADRVAAPVISCRADRSDRRSRTPRGLLAEGEDSTSGASPDSRRCQSHGDGSPITSARGHVPSRCRRPIGRTISDSARSGVDGPSMSSSARDAVRVRVTTSVSWPLACDLASVSRTGCRDRVRRGDRRCRSRGSWRSRRRPRSASIAQAVSSGAKVRVARAAPAAGRRTGRSATACTVGRSRVER